MDDSIELTIIKKCMTNLEVALLSAHVDRNLVHFLNHEGFLPENIHDELLKPASLLNDAQKAGELVKWIKNRVQQDSSSYHVLVAELKKHGKCYHPILELLENEYSKYRALVPSSQQRSRKCMCIFKSIMGKWDN